MTTNRRSPEFQKRPPGFFTSMSSGSQVEVDGRVINWMEPRPSLIDSLGHLRLGAITFTADGAGGLAAGLAAPEGTWVVTTDLEMRLVAPIGVRPVRIVGTEVRTGSTTSVCDLDLFDDATDEVLGVGSITSHCLTVESPPSTDLWPRGVRLDAGVERMDLPLPLGEYLGLTSTPDHEVDLDVTEQLRNPWGMLHGGLIAIGAEEAAIRHPATAGRPPLGLLIRYLAPSRVGPIRFRPEVLGVTAEQALVRVRSYDVGADRLTTSTLVSLGARHQG